MTGCTSSNIENGDARVRHHSSSGVRNCSANGAEVSTLAMDEAAAADNKGEGEQNHEGRRGFHKQLRCGLKFGAIRTCIIEKKRFASKKERKRKASGNQ